MFIFDKFDTMELFGGESMNPMAKILIIGGVIMIIAGLLWQIGGRFLNLGRLPGDIVVEKENFRFYFPIMTSIVISVVLSLIFYLFRLFK
jgi:hypothetical protein